MTFSRRGFLRLGMVAGAAKVLRIPLPVARPLQSAVVQRSAAIGIGHSMGP